MQSGVNAADEGASPSRIQILQVWSLVVLTFLPYFAIPLGSNTNVPLSSIVALTMLPTAAKSKHMLGPLFLLIMIPTTTTFAGYLTTPGEINVQALIAWPLHVVVLTGFAVAARVARSHLQRVVRVCLWLTVVLAVVQKYVFLDRGSIPFLGYYSTPGYASVANNAFEIANYVRRPFTTFPEPSFMAGSVALACAALLILLPERLKMADYLLVGGSLIAIYLSSSGSGIASMGLLLVLAVYRGRIRVRRAMLLVVALVCAFVLGLSLYGSRSSASNYSWGDRLTSIEAAFRYLVGHVGPFLLGTGTGTASTLYENGTISLDGLTYHSDIPDLFSTFGRIVLETGVIGGLAMMVILMQPVARAVRQDLGVVAAIAGVLIVLIVGGLTISYQSAAWLWAVPGICMGLLASRDPMRGQIDAHRIRGQ
ncbi:O-antigen ligase [Curtobacterium sp. 9128]|uniref:O-antigen ligase family protein n=1 Tax=Curtobacterium sp. 9128 TaxID=1793722 RepID=UPI0011A86200|nr:hypothetical protein [Curtobacterium sp. 9128]